LTEAAFVTRGCSCYVLKWCRIARVAIPARTKVILAKQSQFFRKLEKERRFEKRPPGSCF